MIITKLRLIGAQTVDLPLEGVGPLSPYVLKAADGLGPSAVDVSIVPALESGGHYQGRRPQLREIVLRVGLQPEWNIGQTPQELRSDLYGLLTPKYGALVKIQLMDEDVVVAETEGHVKTMEVAIFSKDPEVQIAMDCVEPYFLAPAAVSQTPAKTVSGSDTTFVVNNPGTAPSGFFAEFVFQAAVTGPVTLKEENIDGRFMTIDASFAIGDVLFVDTRFGSRSVKKKLAGSSTILNLLGFLSDTSTWLQLHSGENPMRITGNNFNWGPNGVLVRYAYWGV